MTDSAENHHNQSVEGEKEPHVLAEMCLRELVSRATYGKIDTVVKPLLMWVPQEGVVRLGQVVRHSISEAFKAHCNAHYFILHKYFTDTIHKCKG